MLVHANYPHEEGYLYDCPACEARCWCVEGSSECVYEGEHRPAVWSAVQVCGQCGEGTFSFADDYGEGPVCVSCGHVHALDPFNLDAGEEFVADAGGMLAVRAYDALGVAE